MLVRKKATVSRIQGKNVYLALENGQEITISLEELLSTPEVGAPFTITVAPQEEAELEQNALAKVLINQLLEHGETST